MTTMTVEAKTCQIYPSAQMQLCVRIKVLVTPLKEGEDGTWLADDEPLRHLELNCCQRGLERLLQKIDDGTSPPKKRGAKSDGV